MEENRAIFQGFRLAKWVLRIFGGILALIAVATLIAGIQESQWAHAMVETINKSRMAPEKSHPTGDVVDYDLEARIVGDDTWHHGAIAAKFGDYVEVRFRIASADSSNIGPEGLSFMSTDGFAPTEFDGQKYASEDRYIGYIPVGTYEFSRKDWLSGQAASSLTVSHNGDRVDELLLIPPYGEINVRLVLALTIFALIIGILGPIAVSLLERRRIQA